MNVAFDDHDPRPAERHPTGERPGIRGPLARLLSRPRDLDLELDDEQAETMHALLAAGVTPTRARAYLDAGRPSPVAESWARTGVGAVQAMLYRCLGLPPEEAARLAEAGTDAEELLCAWWDSGVPRTEAASWIASGTSPEDAALAEVACSPGPDRPDRDRRERGFPQPSVAPPARTTSAANAATA